MKKGTGFKESASFSNSAACMPEELILSLSMGHLYEILLPGRKLSLCFPQCVCAAAVSINC